MRNFSVIEGIEELETKYLKKEISADDVIEALKGQEIPVTKEGWYEHIKYKVKPQIAVELHETHTELAQDVVDKFHECLKGMDRLKRIIDRTIDIDDLDPQILNTYIKAEDSMRKYIETLAKLQGEYKGSGVIHAKNVNIEYNNVIAQVLQDACHVCKKKFAETLEPLILKKID